MTLEAVASSVAVQGSSSAGLQGINPADVPVGGVSVGHTQAWSSATAAASAAGPQASTGVAALDASKFDASNNPQVSAGNHVLTDPALNRSTEGGTPGDKIIKSLQSASNTMQGRLAGIDSALEASGGDLGKMLKIQVQVTQFSIEADLTSKVVSKSTQDLDQLTKMQ